MIYYYGGLELPIYALLAYAKSAKTDLTPVEKRTIAALATALKAAGRNRT